MTTQTKARGLMVGLGVGNLLGVSVEGWRAEDIRATWPDGLRDIVTSPCQPDDDDLAQALILARASLNTSFMDLDDIARELWNWAELNGLGIGIHTRQVLTLYGGKSPQLWALSSLPNRMIPVAHARPPTGFPMLEASKITWDGNGNSENNLWEQSNEMAAGNGALMRCAPLAARWHRDVHQDMLLHNTIATAALTHWDRRCIWSCVFLNFTLATLLRGETDVGLQILIERVMVHYKRVEQSGVLVPFGDLLPIPSEVLEGLNVLEVDDVLALGLDGSQIGYTVLAMRVGMWCSLRAWDFEYSLIQIINAGGDTDTNGAIAGAVLGATFGLDTIPKRWRQRVLEIRRDQTSLETWADLLAGFEPLP